MDKKQVLLLSDTKAGHQNQSRALLKELEAVGGGENLSVKRIQVLFKSKFREKFFSLFSFLIYPFIKESIPFLNYFIEENIIGQLRQAEPDIIISAGSGLVPFILLLSKIHHAKRIVLMHPAFPFSLFTYDLAIVSKHDAGLRVKGSLERILALSPFDKNIIELESEVLKKRLTSPERVKIGLLIGGDSKNYKFSRERMYLAIEQIIAACKKLDVDFVATTCRRTPKDYEIQLNGRLKNVSSCSLLVLADKNEASNLVSAMIGLCSILIATEESVSMISEPISAGKKTLVLKLNDRIYYKYRCFHNLLIDNGLVHIAGYQNLAEKIIKVYNGRLYDLDEKAKSILSGEQRALRKRLSKLI